MARSTRHLVDSGLLPLLDRLPAFDLTPEILPLLCADFGARLSVADDPATLQKVETTIRAIPGRGGDPDVSVVVHRPRAQSEPSGAILHMHGGGYVTGNASSFAPAHRTMAMALG